MVDSHVHWLDLGLSPVMLDFGFFQLRWYAIAYVIGVVGGYFYLRVLARQSGAPLAERHLEDLAFYAFLGVMLGGRLMYILAYDLPRYMASPISVLNLQEGGMSFHGGLLGAILGIVVFSSKQKLPALRIHDYVACVAPIGLFFGRLANFVNAELWGAPTTVSWAVRFPEIVNGVTILGPPRHPSQLYEAILEGLVLFVVLFAMFWKTQARYLPGMLTGAFGFFYGLFRFMVEFVREPDPQLTGFAQQTGLHMGQWLSLPLILGGTWLMWTAKKRVRTQFDSIRCSSSSN